jgi:hypothetical protein
LKKNSLLPKTFGHSGKILMLNILGILKKFILPNNFKHLINVEKKSFMPKILGHSGKILTLKKKVGQFENLCLIISGR